MNGTGPIKVMVVDDSAYVRQLLKTILESDERFSVAAVARDGREALALVDKADPDVITLDLDMPGIDGFSFLRIIMHRRPKPVVVVSSYAGRTDVLRALDLGAIDFVAKPTRTASTKLADIGEEIKAKIFEAAFARIDLYVKQSVGDVTGVHGVQALSAPLPLPEASGHARTLVQPKGIVVVGASTGGPRAVRRLLGSYGPETWTMAVAQHMPPQFTTEFAARLARKTGRLVEEAVQGRKMAAGGISVAPGGFQMEITMDGVWPVTRLSSPAPTDRYAPSVDKLFVSAAKAMGANVIALVLTGMGNDGLAGAAAVKQAGGLVIAEDVATAVVYGMPRQVVDAGLADKVLPLEAIGEELKRLTGSLSALQDERDR